LAEKIQYVLDNPEEAEAMGNKARQKCIEKYSWDAMEEILLKVFKKYE
jgi:glycosyltransferase involved in cell wall biosynthesis